MASCKMRQSSLFIYMSRDMWIIPHPSVDGWMSNTIRFPLQVIDMLQLPQQQKKWYTSRKRRNLKGQLQRTLSLRYFWQKKKKKYKRKKIKRGICTYFSKRHCVNKKQRQIRVGRFLHNHRTREDCCHLC